VLPALLFSSAIALTFDDLPGTSYAEHEKLLAALRKHQAPAIGFVNSAQRSKDEVASIVALWLRNGQQLGNHTAHHVDLNKVTAEEFERDVIEGEATLPKRAWFRYPYLHTGTSLAVKDAVASLLTKRGYRNAVVTLDSDEYLYNNAYAAALEKHDIAHAQRIAAAYLDFMGSIVTFYEKRTNEVVGHPIPQVLLLHASALSADHLDELLNMLERRGYAFVTLDQAMRDPAYALPDNYAGSRGLSWIHRWGLAKGMPLVMEPDAKIPN
jgi:peptidoglycan-N-acetylglucosamine deacetylase